MTEDYTNAKIKYLNHADLLLLIHNKGIIYCKLFFQIKYSPTHSTFKFWNAFCNAFTEGWPKK